MSVLFNFILIVIWFISWIAIIIYFRREDRRFREHINKLNETLKKAIEDRDKSYKELKEIAEGTNSKKERVENYD